ncbi:MAG TPA: TonB-dependent receptor plug domain-containing protein, partial [Methylomirabilota bacterium]|nr:TonB-dependent receptor plug domain-containing protein [Methylomirabilota bacterium]
MRRLAGSGVAGALLAGLAVGAAEGQPPAAAPTAGEVHRADPVVVTATRSEQRLEEIGASVTVVPEEVLEAQQYRLVEEALRAVPGVDVQRSGSPGKLTTIRIRGANPTQVQVLIDGVRVKSATTGDFDFADLPLDDIERIEVVRGPQSTLYGADAVGGVVNIITRRGQGTPSAFVDVEGGNYETFRLRAGASGAVGPWSASLGASGVTTRGQFDNDDQQMVSVNGRVAYALPNRGEVALVGRYTDAHKGLPFATVFPDFDPNREQDDRFALASLEWKQPWTAWYE